MFGVRSRQLIEHGSTASSLVLVGVGRLLGLVTGRRQVGRHRWTTTGWTVCHRTTTGWMASGSVAPAACRRRPRRRHRRRRRLGLGRDAVAAARCSTTTDLPVHHTHPHIRVQP